MSTPRVGRPPASRAKILEAADSLFREADPDDLPGLTMDAIAAVAGVGKGTLFRAFGDREGLLDALSATKFERLRAVVEDGTGPFGSEVSAADRLVAFLDAVLTFKLENSNLMRARETAGGDRGSERYRWTHELLTRLLVEAAPDTGAEEAAYSAHTLLAALQVNLLDELAKEGLSVAAIRRAQRRLALAVLTADGRASV